MDQGMNRHFLLKLWASFLLLLITSVLQAQPDGYYNTATGTGATLKTQLYNIINNHTVRPLESP
jgi:hypothetical protein